MVRLSCRLYFQSAGEMYDLHRCETGVNARHGRARQFRSADAFFSDTEDAMETLTTMVVGGMIGAGVFSIPRNFAMAQGRLRCPDRVNPRRRGYADASIRVPEARK